LRHSQKISTGDLPAQGANPNNLENPLANTIAAAIDIGGGVLLKSFGEEIHPLNGKPYKPQQSAVVSSIAEAEEFFADVPDGRNVYYGAGIRKLDAGKQDKNSVLAIPHFWVEIDFNETPEDEARKRIAELYLKPSAVIHSGGGLHCYWILREPEIVDDPKPLEAVNRGLAEILGGDSGADVTRLLRPAFLSTECNYPDEKKRARRRKKSPVVVEYWNGARYNPSDFDQFKSEEEAPEESKPQVSLGVLPRKGKLSARLVRDLRQSPKLRSIWLGESPDPEIADRSKRDATLTTALIGRGYTDNEIAAALINFSHGKAQIRSNPKVYIARLIQNQRRFVRDTRTPEEVAAHGLIDRIEAQMNAVPWAGAAEVMWLGKDGPKMGTVQLQSCRAVLCAFIKNARTLKRTSFVWSQRLISEEAGTGRRTTQKAVSYLEMNGLLRVRRGKGGCGFEITGFSHSGTNSLQENQQTLRRVDNWFRSENFSGTMDMGADVFRRKGLGKRGHHILTATLSHGPMTPKEITQRTGIPLKTVYRNLKKLTSSGAMGREQGKYHPHDCDLEAAAKEMGTAGTQGKQIARNACERSLHKQWKKRTAERLNYGKEKLPMAAKADFTPPAPRTAPQVAPKPAEIEPVPTTNTGPEIDWEAREELKKEWRHLPPRTASTKEELVEA